MNYDYPITPRTRRELLTDARFAAATDKTINKLVKNAEHQRLKEQGKFLQELIRDRERELRYRHRHNAYDSGESGYSSVSTGRRSRVRTERIWERMRNRERREQERKEREIKEEEKREIDAIFNTLLHDDGDLSDSNDYEFSFPEFMNFDEIKRGFDEQMKREREERKQREEAERKAASVNKGEDEEGEEVPESRCLMSHIHLAADWCRERYVHPAPVIKEDPPQLILEDIDLSQYMSTDEDNEEDEDDSTSAITEKAMKWTINNSEASTSAGTSSGATRGWLPPPNTVFIVHDSDSE